MKTTIGKQTRRCVIGSEMRRYVIICLITLGLAISMNSRAAAQSLVSIVFPDAGGTLANGINNSGQIVGGYGTVSDPENHGFLLNHGDFSTIDFPDATNTLVSGKFA